MPTRPDILDPDTSGRPDVGPSDSSDSASDLPPGLVHTDSDSQATGERESVDLDLFDDEADGEDIAPDHVTDADDAGVPHSPRDPVRNGG
ncbi:hypothetical protein [Achromobacter piechaudii]|uniref:MatE family transporter n=1 Tax=Achromobacter piechaudii TaxID=72556 RepID=A0A6S7CYG8_9BURK|nr:hypothetical protein [Achromobacter piechaudii]CAB3870356.1 hypothetical protein LMG1861_02730 [Achromobacter piechaudii]